MSSLGVEYKTRQPYLQSKFEKNEIKKVKGKLKVGKVPVIHSLTREMLMYRGDAYVEWLLWIYHVA